MIRTFIALEIPTPIQHQIGRQIAQLQIELRKGIKWETSEKIHVTLKFLGEIPEERIHDLIEMIDESTESCPAIRLEVGGLGVFPNWDHPTVVWIGAGENETLAGVHRALELSARELGFRSEAIARFHPHLTIGRIRRGLATEELGTIARTLKKQSLPHIGEAVCDRITLFKSELQRNGSIYTPLYQRKLSRA
ncbi:MAG: RNA 2',3'-cyclic phosphodiesterase [Anaerolineaceae bacterium]|nr:RNA 2',3'-cyclic phosphodiesterase [Anaerolineaceae bacterium]